jgi:hypothetical protein
MVIRLADPGSRNGLPECRGYRYRAPRPAWMLRAIADAMAEHGEPTAADWDRRAVSASAAPEPGETKEQRRERLARINRERYGGAS